MAGISTLSTKIIMYCNEPKTGIKSYKIQAETVGQPFTEVVGYYNCYYSY